MVQHLSVQHCFNSTVLNVRYSLTALVEHNISRTPHKFHGELKCFSVCRIRPLASQEVESKLKVIKGHMRNPKGCTVLKQPPKCSSLPDHRALG